jgi:hypothetical protein
LIVLYRGIANGVREHLTLKQANVLISKDFPCKNEFREFARKTFNNQKLNLKKQHPA